jgi:hypothetical protein
MDDAVRDEIAFIRSVIEEGRGYATDWSGDMLVWGVVIAAATLGHYAAVRGWWGVDRGCAGSRPAGGSGRSCSMRFGISPRRCW